MSITPEVLVAYAAGHLRPEASERVKAAIAQDEDLALELEGVRALVEELGPAGTLDYLDAAADRLTMKTATKRQRPAWAWVVPLTMGIAASVAALLYFVWGGPTSKRDEFALAVLNSDPRLELMRDELPPSWAAAYDAHDYAAAEQSLRAADLSQQQECFMLGVVLFRQGEAKSDSALMYLVRSAEMSGPLSDQAWLYAGALAISRGQEELAAQYLTRSHDARAEALRNQK